MKINPSWILIPLVAIYLVGFGINMMDVDAAQYASMSREMMQSHNWLHLYDEGKDYLDKPPFLFWISALSMKLFGANNFGYRFPTLLFSLLSIYSTFRLALLFYKRETAIMAALILGSSQGFFLLNHDVRTDGILMGWVIFSLWQWAAWFASKKNLHLLLGSIAIAFGMMTKGPIALFVPLFAFGCDILLHRDPRLFFKWQYLVSLVIIALLLVPISIGLYTQFDLHPEKVVNYKQQVSGLKFFYWTQSFGRIIGESYWNNHSNILTLMESMLWSFLPWTILFLVALFMRVKNIIQQGFKLFRNQEAISVGGFLLTYISLGLSKYQLPHYIFVVFPLAAIITADFLSGLLVEKKYPALLRILLPVQVALYFLLGIALIFLLFSCFNSIPTLIPLLATIGFVVAIVLLVRMRDKKKSFVYASLFTIMWVNLFLNLAFYPALLRYQAGSEAGIWLRKAQIPPDKIFIYQYTTWRSLHFYAREIVPHKDDIQMITRGDRIITTEDKLPDFIKNGKGFDIIHRGIDYPVSRLSAKFLNPKTREKQLGYYVIIQIK